MSSNAGKWVGSHDGEWFDGPVGDTPEDAIELWDDCDRPCVAVAQIRLPSYTHGHAESVIENMECRAADNAHPDCEVSIGVTQRVHMDELDALIAQVLTDWMQRHGYAFSHWELDNITKVVGGKPVERGGAPR